MTELFLIVWLRFITIGVRYFLAFWYIDHKFVREGYVIYITTVLDILCLLVTGAYTLR